MKIVNLFYHLWLQELLHQLFIHGPYTKGIFRKSGNLRQVRECQEKLDNEEEYDFSTLPIQTCSALLKVRNE